MSPEGPQPPHAPPTRSVFAETEPWVALALCLLWALLVRAGEVRSLGAGGPLLGVSRHVTYEEEVVALEPGDMLVIYSDGAIDAANYDGERFGRDRLLDAIRRHAHHGAQRAVEEIRWDIRRFTGLATQADDLTLVVVKVL